MVQYSISYSLEYRDGVRVALVAHLGQGGRQREVAAEGLLGRRAGREGGRHEGEVGGEGDATPFVVGGDAGARGEVVAEEEEGGVCGGVDGVGEVAVVGAAGGDSGGVADEGEGGVEYINGST